jgi:hypothetical protein
MDSTAQASVSITAKVFRIDWNRKPRLFSDRLWLWLGKRRVPGTGRWEDLGEIASSARGNASIIRR